MRRRCCAARPRRERQPAAAGDRDGRRPTPAAEPPATQSPAAPTSRAAGRSRRRPTERRRRAGRRSRRRRAAPQRPTRRRAAAEPTPPRRRAGRSRRAEDGRGRQAAEEIRPTTSRNPTRWIGTSSRCRATARSRSAKACCGGWPSPGLDNYFGEVIVPTEKVTEFKGGKKRVIKRKLYPGYLVVHMEINEDTWFLVRETPGIGDFTGVGRPAQPDARRTRSPGSSPSRRKRARRRRS